MVFLIYKLIYGGDILCIIGGNKFGKVYLTGLDNLYRAVNIGL